MKLFEGIVVANKMKDTAIVEVWRTVVHPLYKKRLKKSSRFKVDTTGLVVEVGTKVKIVETRPLSSGKYFKVQTVVQKEEKTEKKKEKK